MKIKIIYVILVLLFLPILFTIAQQGEDYEFTANDGLTYSTSNNGIIKIEDDYKVISHVGFVLTGTVNNQSRRYTSEDFNWAWKKSYYNYSAQVDFNHTTNTSINQTFRVDVFTAYNNKANFNWTQVWEFDEQRDPKMKHIITNNLGVPITNAKFWYVHTLPRDTLITFNKTRYLLSNNAYHFQGNFNNLLGKLDLGELTFFYHDLINSSFDITDIYIGNGSVIGYPNRLIVGLGITKGVGTFPDGYTIILDPSDTGFKSPATTGSPSNDWLSGANVKASDNSRAYEVTIGDLLDTSDYSISIPDGATIVGIEIKVEGHSSDYNVRLGGDVCPE